MTLNPASLVSGGQESASGTRISGTGSLPEKDEATKKVLESMVDSMRPLKSSIEDKSKPAKKKKGSENKAVKKEKSQVRDLSSIV